MLQGLLNSLGVCASVDRGAITAARDDVRNLLVAASGDAARVLLHLERVERGTNDVVRVSRTHRLGDDVMDAQHLEDGAHGAAGNDTRARRSRTQHHLARTVTADGVELLYSQQLRSVDNLELVW